MSAAQTLAEPVRHAVDIRKSRFVAHAAPVGDVAAALAFVHSTADALATHNCWAYRVGQSYRFADDGEPSGTAGRPILLAIDAQHCDQVVVIVTRWYGGIKLGAGGLARAYGGCAAECLRLATKRTLVDRVDARLRCDFAALALIQARLGDFDATQVEANFDAEGAVLDVRLARARVEALRVLVRDLTRGRGALTMIDVAP